MKRMVIHPQPENEAGDFVEFRHKVQSAEVLSAAMERRAEHCREICQEGKSEEICVSDWEDVE